MVRNKLGQPKVPCICSIICFLKAPHVLSFTLLQLKEYIDDTEDFINIQLVCFVSR